MSPTTTIQAHTAYEAINGINPEFAGSDSRSLFNPVNSASERPRVDCRWGTGEGQASDTIAKLARDLSLDDFGGRSDAPGG